MAKATIKKPKKTMAKPTKKSAKSGNAARMNLIQTEAKKLWATGKHKKYSDAVSQAVKNLKKEGKM